MKTMRCWFGSAALCALISSGIYACGANNTAVDDEEEGDVNSGNNSENIPSQDQLDYASQNVLYGVIYPRTGLSAQKCRPEIEDESKGGVFTGVYTTAEIDKIKAMRLAENSPHKSEFPYRHSVSVGGATYTDYYSAITDGTTSPYEIEATAQNDGVTSLLSENNERVCGLKLLENGEYTLQTYESWSAAETDGARVTHKDNCGFCSTMQNLAVYMEKPELTVLVRECAMVLLGNDGTEREREDRARQCIRDIGFDEECISMAYERTCLNTGGMNWNYMNKILQRWHEAGLHTAAQVRQGDRRKAVPKGASGELGQAELDAIARIMQEG